MKQQQNKKKRKKNRKRETVLLETGGTCEQCEPRINRLIEYKKN